MLTSRGLLGLRRLPAIVRACSDSQGSSAGSPSDPDSLASFLNVVQSTQQELKEKRLAELQEKQASQLSAEESEQPKFTKLLRNSELTRYGYIKKGFVTKGIVTNVVNETIFVDFGGKFPFITQRPTENAEFYVRGAEVRIIFENLQNFQSDNSGRDLVKVTNAQFICRCSPGSSTGN